MAIRAASNPAHTCSSDGGCAYERLAWALRPCSGNNLAFARMLWLQTQAFLLSNPSCLPTCPSSIVQVAPALRSGETLALACAEVLKAVPQCEAVLVNCSSPEATLPVSAHRLCRKLHSLCCENRSAGGVRAE